MASAVETPDAIVSEAEEIVNNALNYSTSRRAVGEGR
jgi:hypothetical protein